VEQTEVEKLIGELETALDRLRSLYEQYFVGMERIEPAVPRKDVERRLYVLRKEQIRNTALRYRFQMVLQKYNTYQTHWQRVCREIENGTYKRHLMRAQRRFGSTRPPRRGSMRPPEVHPEPGAPLPKDLAAELATLDDDFAPASFDVDISFDEKPSSRPRPPEAPSAPAPPSPALAPPTLAAAPPRPAGAGGAPAWKKVGAPAAPGAPPAQRSAAPAAPIAAQWPPRPAAPAAPIAAQWPPRPAAPPSASTGPASVQRPGPPAPRTAAPGPAPAPGASPPAARPAVSPPRAAPPPPTAGLAPDRPAPVPPTTAAGRPPAPRPSPSNRPPSFPTPRPPPGSAELSEKRLRQIYVEYVDAKRRQNESTAAITYQSVAKSLRESGDRLRQKHGKDVDFEVAVKDGKTVLRPVLK
jgi:hypothetical protein